MVKILLPLLLIISAVLPAHAATHTLDNLDLKQTQQLLRSGVVTPQQLLEHYQGRIARHDDNGVTLNAVVQFSPDLEQQVKALSRKLESGQKPGPLFGAFVLLKDNIDTGDGMVNSAGSWLLRDHKPSQDAFMVTQLRQAGAIIMGKTNLSEWANFRSEMSSSGWSSLYGQTRNAHDPTRSPCGSSSGSGVAIAADFATMAIGTETDGSVVCPAAVNGIVGIKPTLGLVSRSGIIPIAHSQDTAGPMTRSVADAVYLLQAMLGEDGGDSASLPPIDLTKHLIKDGLKDKRIGIVRNYTGYHPQLDEVFNAQLKLLRQAGAILVDNADIETKGKWGKDEYTVLLAEFKADLASYFASHDTPLNSLQQAIEANENHRGIVMPIFGQEIFYKSAEAPALTDNAYLDALRNSKKQAGELGIDATLAKHKVDMLIAPTTAPAWKIDHIDGDHYLGSVSSPAAVSGYPHITVPMGRVAHMPVGISFFGSHLSEGILIEAAYAYEQLSQARVAPDLP